MELDDGVAVRLAALCLSDDGRLRRFDIWDAAVRGALLVDLVRLGRLAEEADSIGLDPTPTGFLPADRLLAAVEVEPARPLVWWIDHGGVRVHDVADAAVVSGRWTVRRTVLGRRRYADRSPRATGDRSLADRGPDADLPPDSAALRALATACGARGRRPEEAGQQDLAASGPLGWICATVTTHLLETHRQNLRTAGAADGRSSSFY